MVVVEVCIGSACYVHGSNQLVELLREMIAKNHWEEKITLKGAFCMQACTRGLGIRINGRPIYGVGLHNAKEVLYQEISSALNAA